MQTSSQILKKKSPLSSRPCLNHIELRGRPRKSPWLANRQGAPTRDRGELQQHAEKPPPPVTSSLTRLRPILRTEKVRGRRTPVLLPRNPRHKTLNPPPPLPERLRFPKHQSPDSSVPPYHSTVWVFELWGSHTQIRAVPTPIVGLTLQGVDSPSLPLATLIILFSFPSLLFCDPSPICSPLATL